MFFLTHSVDMPSVCHFPSMIDAAECSYFACAVHISMHILYLYVFTFQLYYLCSNMRKNLTLRLKWTQLIVMT